MKKIDKTLFFIASFIGLGLSIGIMALLYPIPFLTYEVKRCLELSPFLYDVFAVFIFLICLCFFLLLLVIIFFPSKSNDVVMIKNKGKIQFSKQTIESTVRYSFADLDDINFSKVRAKINRQPEKIKIYVKLSLNDSSKLLNLTEAIQEKISSSLQASLGITVKSIDIKVVEHNPDRKKLQNDGKNAAIDSRVL